MQTCQFVLASFFFACLLTDAQASSVYTLSESFGSENIIIEFQGGLINGSNTLLGVTEVDKVFINGVAATSNGIPADFTEQYSSALSTNAQIDLSNPNASNFSISEPGFSLLIAQTYSFPFFDDVIQTETGQNTFFTNGSLSSYSVNNGPYNPVTEPSSIALLLMGFSSLLSGRFGSRLRKA